MSSAAVASSSRPVAGSSETPPPAVNATTHDRPPRSGGGDSHRSGGAADKRSPSSGAASSSTPTLRATSPKRQLRDQVQLLTKCLPSPAELLRVAESSPEEAQKLHEFSRRVRQKIHELDLERQRLVDLDRDKRETAKQRARGQFVSKHTEIIDEFMTKVLTAEDRQAEMAKQRRDEIERAKILREINQIDLQKAREQAEQQRLARLEAKRKAWSRAVRAVEEAKEQHRLETEEKLHAGTPAEGSWWEHQLALRRQKEREVEELNELAAQREAELAKHAEMARQQVQARALHARATRRDVANPEASVVLVETKRQKLAKQEERAVTAMTKAMADREQKIRDDAAKREQKQQHALSILEKLTDEQLRQQRAVEDKLRERMEAHTNRIADREEQSKQTLTKMRAKQSTCMQNVAEGEVRARSKLAAKIFERTTRIAGMLGVDESSPLPPVRNLPVHKAPPPRTAPEADAVMNNDDSRRTSPARSPQKGHRATGDASTADSGSKRTPVKKTAAPRGDSSVGQQRQSRTSRSSASQTPSLSVVCELLPPGSVLSECFLGLEGEVVATGATTGPSPAPATKKSVKKEEEPVAHEKKTSAKAATPAAAPRAASTPPPPTSNNSSVFGSLQFLLKAEVGISSAELTSLRFLASQAE